MTQRDRAADKPASGQSVLALPCLRARDDDVTDRHRDEDGDTECRRPAQEPGGQDQDDKRPAADQALSPRSGPPGRGGLGLRAEKHAGEGEPHEKGQAHRKRH
jgi:hypothetical protein